MLEDYAVYNTIHLHTVSVYVLVGHISHRDSWCMEATFAVNTLLSSVCLSVRTVTCRSTVGVPWLLLR